MGGMPPQQQPFMGGMGGGKLHDPQYDFGNDGGKLFGGGNVSYGMGAKGGDNSDIGAMLEMQQAQQSQQSLGGASGVSGMGANMMTGGQSPVDLNYREQPWYMPAYQQWAGMKKPFTFGR
jgi:hypothetical protein